jgi:hypothetical protein
MATISCVGFYVMTWTSLLVSKRQVGGSTKVGRKEGKKKNRKEICAKQTNMKNREGIIFWGILDLIFLRAVIDDVPKNTKKIYGFSPLDKKSIFTCVL